MSRGTSTPGSKVPDAGPMHFIDAAAWESWLAEHHDAKGGVWLKIAKRRSPAVSVTIEQALETALCFGWIDGHRRSHDEHFYLQRFSRRRKRSPWSRMNVERVEALTAAGRMRPPGLAEVAAAQADGRWAAAYPAQRDATVPPDLTEALASHPQAATRFESLDKTTRYLLILPLLKATTPATRAAHLQKAITTLLTQENAAHPRTPASR
ncbi:YdeI/OmpD-associated family protein [Thermomonospora cellulosilytica]|uniref:Uncharacterized protein YdeI (YjbR/CyaY-like superfamily) n=1 Tax=Thermomonospora cellulosilytica TaxID=1411118 RepID=A0A7W3MUL8_9ACTN|nr:YdeI/OmpD-associated family protein [Thermomonospora cellulosilytica]MBA9002163.1 uncharacterized protein YdeI (YjbR/CyaY-like superfamily) [Thermomonospora cellulosilytica]